MQSDDNGNDHESIRTVVKPEGVSMYLSRDVSFNAPTQKPLGGRAIVIIRFRPLRQVPRQGKDVISISGVSILI
jgi:hypothetical protein